MSYNGNGKNTYKKHIVCGLWYVFWYSIKVRFFDNLKCCQMSSVQSINVRHEINVSVKSEIPRDLITWPGRHQGAVKTSGDTRSAIYLDKEGDNGWTNEPSAPC